MIILHSVKYCIFLNLECLMITSVSLAKSGICWIVLKWDFGREHKAFMYPITLAHTTLLIIYAQLAFLIELCIMGELNLFRSASWYILVFKTLLHLWTSHVTVSVTEFYSMK